MHQTGSKSDSDFSFAPNSLFYGRISMARTKNNTHAHGELPKIAFKTIWLRGPYYPSPPFTRLLEFEKVWCR
jgi:hypothetical protein